MGKGAGSKVGGGGGGGGKGKSTGSGNFSAEETQKIETAANQIRAMSPDKQEAAIKQTDDTMRRRIQTAIDERTKLERNIQAQYPEIARVNPEKMPEIYKQPRNRLWNEAQTKVEQRQREFQLWKETQRRLKS